MNSSPQSGPSRSAPRRSDGVSCSEPCRADVSPDSRASENGCAAVGAAPDGMKKFRMIGAGKPPAKRRPACVGGRRAGGACTVLRGAAGGGSRTAGATASGVGAATVGGSGCGTGGTGTGAGCGAGGAGSGVTGGRPGGTGLSGRRSVPRCGARAAGLKDHRDFGGRRRWLQFRLTRQPQDQQQQERGVQCEGQPPGAAQRAVPAAGVRHGGVRSGRESNPHSRICSPLHHHSATGPHDAPALSVTRPGSVKPPHIR